MTNKVFFTLTMALAIGFYLCIQYASTFRSSEVSRSYNLFVYGLAGLPTAIGMSLVLWQSRTESSLTLVMRIAVAMPFLIFPLYGFTALLYGIIFASR
jgi:hypothetical protein